MTTTLDSEADWQYGGGGDLFQGLTWSNRPDMTGCEASEDLQRAWVATILAIRELRGTLRSGSCFLINLAAAPLVEKVLGEPVTPCAGYAGFVGDGGKFECGFRYRPEKWAKYIDASAGAHLSPLQDIHTWLTSDSHIIDFATGDPMGNPDDAWPPLIYWPKWKFPKHPREARGQQTILLWRSAAALTTTNVMLAPVIELITERALCIYDELVRSSVPASWT